MCAGLAFYNLGEGPDNVSKRLALLFFILLLFELLPFCYMSFYVADRRFFAADVSNDLYHPSAYYISAVIAGGTSSNVSHSSHSPVLNDDFCSAPGMRLFRPHWHSCATASLSVIVEVLAQLLSLRSAQACLTEYPGAQGYPL